MFSLEKQQAKLDNVNPRAEIHGPDKVLAVDLKISFKSSNDVLSEFDPFLKSSFYTKGDQAQGELIDDANHLPVLKFPLINSALPWDKEYSGYETIVHLGLGGKNSDVEMIECQVDKFKFELLDGGSVIVHFRVICHPKESELGKLCSLIQQEIEVSLIPPSEEQQLLAA
jgi:hypothetical protein